MTGDTAALRGPLRKRDSHLWSRDQHDWYVEPVWCSARLFEVESFPAGLHDPACGMGRIVKAARAAGIRATGSDLVYRGKHDDFLVSDFLTDGNSVPNIVSNPPFGIAEHFVSHALNLAQYKVAMLLPANWVQGDKRSRWLAQTPLKCVYFLTPRPSMPPGDVIRAGGNPGNGTTDYAWFVWDCAHSGPAHIGWIRRDCA